MKSKRRIAVLKLHRYKQDKQQTSSVLVVLNQSGHPLFSCIALERGWLNNQRNKSCVPAGVYNVVLEYSPKFKAKLWELKGVPDRSECKFHRANYWYQLEGCIALGTKFIYINRDKYLDASKSVKTMRKFHKVMNNFSQAKLFITTARGINNDYNQIKTYK